MSRSLFISAISYLCRLRAMSQVQRQVSTPVDTEPLPESGWSSPQNSGDVESQWSNSSDVCTLSDPEPMEMKKFRVDARVISDAIIGLSDGLTVPFALTAGLSALGDTRVVISGGLAELIAGAISSKPLVLW